MTKTELSRHDGRQGRRALVAVNGRVYDVTDSPLWREGRHESQHGAGCDLTEELKTAPHVRAVIERFPVVGTLEAEEVDRSSSAAPIILLAAAALLLLAYLVLR